MFGKLPSSFRNHGNYDATVSKSQKRQMQLIRRFCIAEHEDIWHNKHLNVEIILIFCFCDKLVVQDPKKGPDNGPFRGLHREKKLFF